MQQQAKHFVNQPATMTPFQTLISLLAGLAAGLALPLWAAGLSLPLGSKPLYLFAQCLAIWFPV
jgi:hypothetical protein